MSDFNVIIEKMSAYIENPAKAVLDYKNTTGKGAIGCLPAHTPEPLIHAAGLLPVGVWASHTKTELTKQYYPAFVCPIIDSIFELALRGTFDCLDAVLIPTHCDTLVSTGQNWKRAIPQVPFIGVAHPVNRKIPAAVDYLVKEYTYVKEKIEEVTGEKITNESLKTSLAVYNEHNAVMREFVDVAAEYPVEVTSKIRNTVFKSAQFMRKEEHTALVKELIAALKSMTPAPYNGKKVLISGISADSEDMLDILQQNNLVLVADDLAQYTRQYRNDYPVDSDDAITNMALAWQNFEGCSLVYDPKKLRADIIIEDCKKYHADGVIICLMKFCDPEEYDYPILNKKLQAAGIQTLYIEYDSQNAVDEQIRTRIQTFAEIL